MAKATVRPNPGEMPLPPHYDPKKVGSIYRVPYQNIVNPAEGLSYQARAWAKQHGLKNAATDKVKMCVLVIDCQNTFCNPDFELFVAGRSGTGAIDDTRRLCEFIYRNLHRVTKIAATMDTHTAMQIFHDVYFINDQGEHPAPFYPPILADDLKSGKWKVNPAIANDLGNYMTLQQDVIYYLTELENAGRYKHTVWPYHAMLGGIGHALVPSFEEVCFFHNLARSSQTTIRTKGGIAYRERFSAMREEVLTGVGGKPMGQKDTELFKMLLTYDYVVFFGQAKSHCVAWTIRDILQEVLAVDKRLANKFYVVEDGSSPVVVPGVDYTDAANAAIDEFRNAGMNVVRVNDDNGNPVPIESWPGVQY